MMLIRILRDELGTDFRKIFLSLKKWHDVFISGMIIDIGFPLYRIKCPFTSHESLCTNLFGAETRIIELNSVRECGSE